LEPLLLHFNHLELAERLAKEEIQSVVVPKYKLYKSIKTLPLFCYHFRRFISSLELDALHSHLYGPITAAGLSLWMSKTPHIGTMHDTYIVEQRPARIHLLSLAAWMGTQVITVASTMEQRFRKLGSFPNNSMHTIINGIDEIHSLNPDEKLRLRGSLNINPEQVVFISVGRLVSIKRHDLAIKAMAELPDRVRYKLLIVGDGPERDSLNQLVGSLNLEENVSFLGFRNDVQNLLQASDSFLLASDSEGLSCSISEAMMAGLPVIATAVGGNPELVQQDQTGFLVIPNSESALAEKMELLAGDSSLRQKLGDAGRAFATQHLSLQRMYKNYLELYSRQDRP
jgi:glycosyltransferase involved in cell wall biosynthesis